MRRAMVAGAAVLLLGACAPADKSEDVLAPAGDMVGHPPATATTVIDGKEYTYGCPDFPCPVLDIVTDHIEAGRFFWTSPIAGMPTIYLYALNVPVKLRPVVHEDDDIKPPPVEPVAPWITGEEEMVGTFLPPIGQLVCQQVGLQLVAPDGGPWSFASGELILGYMEDSELGWIESNMTTVIPLGDRNWNDLLAGTYAIYPPVPGTPAYHMYFSAALRRQVGDRMYEYPVEHEMMCGSAQYYEPEPPPDPYLIGAEYLKGERLPDQGLVCSDVTLELRSSDNGPWYYETGNMTIEYLRWSQDLGRLVPTGRTSSHEVNPGEWGQLLGGGFVLKPGHDDTGALAYSMLVNGIVERDYRGREWTAPIAHKLTCVGPDLYDLLVNQPR